MMTAQPFDEFHVDYVVEDQLHGQLTTMLRDAHSLTGMDDVRADFGLTGAGQTVVVIDTGIAYDHAALGGGFGEGHRVVGGWDFTEENDGNPYDDGPYGAHGTHVAGIIASDDATHRGVAPGVDLVGLRVFNDDGVGEFDWVEEALGWVHDHRNDFDNPITTVNLSLGTNWNADSIPSWANLEDEFAQLEADGIFISVAAGNSFQDYNDTGLSYPATSPYIVPVAAVDDNGNLSYFSQRNDRVIAAPGRGVMSTVPDYDGNYNGIDDDFSSMSGTSMAAPYVAGAATILRQALELSGATDTTQDDIYDLMRQTADMIYDAATGQSYHRLNLQRAVETAIGDDDFGSTVATAESMGQLGTSTSIDGLIGRLNDVDYFSFTAAMDGDVTFSVAVQDELDVEWSLDGVDGSVDTSLAELTFTVTAGQSFAVGLETSDGLGRFTLDAQFTAAEVVEDVDDEPDDGVGDGIQEDKGEEETEEDVGTGVDVEIVPSYTSSAPGQATVRWNALPGESTYFVRLNRADGTTVSQSWVVGTTYVVNVEAGYYTIDVTAPGRDMVRINLDLSDGSLNLRYDANSEGVTRVRWDAAPTDRAFFTRMTDASGQVVHQGWTYGSSFRVDAPEGHYTFFVSRPGQAFEQIELDVSAASEDQSSISYTSSSPGQAIVRWAGLGESRVFYTRLTNAQGDVVRQGWTYGSAYYVSAPAGVYQFDVAAPGETLVSITLDLSGASASSAGDSNASSQGEQNVVGSAAQDIGKVRATTPPAQSAPPVSNLRLHPVIGQTDLVNVMEETIAESLDTKSSTVGESTSADDQLLDWLGEIDSDVLLPDVHLTESAVNIVDDLFDEIGGLL
jgi:subtilisin family serine protease